MAEYIDSNLIRLRNWERSLVKHRKMLNEIVTTHSNRIDNKVSDIHYSAPCKNKTPNVKDKTFFAKHVRNENIKLACKLVEIQAGYDNHPINPERKPLPLISDKVNNPYRHNEKRRIKKENTRLARRLINIRSTFSLERWKNDYDDTRKYKEIRSHPHLERNKSANPMSECGSPSEKKRKNHLSSSFLCA
ncbi:unnamed protein product [Blepharisma stoltei]|uniref:Uncharacterized protein n=1 Tax=Blepharisma stoltei TaxID=1481888 RepID=A0AAU9J752_9CILI|nr:unnamed protein product [Blepharisma stoltei]